MGRAWHEGQISVNVLTCNFLLAYAGFALAGPDDPALRPAARPAWPDRSPHAGLVLLGAQ